MQKIAILGILVIVILVAGVTMAILKIDGKQNSDVLSVVTPFSDVAPPQFNQAISSNKYTLIDVRTAEEYNGGHLKNAKQADFYQTQEFSDYLDSLDKNEKYLIYCRGGKRSAMTLEIMKKKGFSRVFDLAGGYSAWVASGLPTEK